MKKMLFAVLAVVVLAASGCGSSDEPEDLYAPYDVLVMPFKGLDNDGGDTLFMMLNVQKNVVSGIELLNFGRYEAGNWYDASIRRVKPSRTLPAPHAVCEVISANVVAVPEGVKCTPLTMTVTPVGEGYVLNCNCVDENGVTYNNICVWGLVPGKVAGSKVEVQKVEVTGHVPLFVLTGIPGSGK